MDYQDEMEQRSKALKLGLLRDLHDLHQGTLNADIVYARRREQLRQATEEIPRLDDGDSDSP